MKKKAVLKIRRFKAKLPEDYGELLSVKYVDRKMKVEDPWDKWTGMTFSVHEGVMYFCGSYNKNWFWRLLQKLKERLFPETVEIEYVRFQDAGMI